MPVEAANRDGRTLTELEDHADVERTPLVICGRVQCALDEGRPVVALESTIISHGLPRPENLAVAQELEMVVREAGAEPATIAVLDGRPHVGLGPDELERLSVGEDVRKLGLRDLPLALATRSSGSTTVSATAHLAALAGIQVFATGGLGGVHRGWQDSWDESADLDALSRTPVTIVSAGVKSILDIAASLERLETLNVTVLGYGTNVFPGFYLHSTEHRLDWRADSPEEVVAVIQAARALDLRNAIIVANPVKREFEMEREVHDSALAEALDAAAAEGVRGKELTPFLLDRMVRATGGAALKANLAAVRGNCAVAAAIACAWSERTASTMAGSIASSSAWEGARR